jgi:hypothetical protein
MIVNANGTVHSTTDAYERMAERWELPVTLMGGERAMKAADRTYLPQEPMESDAQYENRKARSTLENFYKWAVENHTGRVFNKPIKLTDDTPEEIITFNKNIDLMGSSINEFYRAVFTDMLVKGISYTYVDYPRSPADMSLAEEMGLGLRPYAIHIKAEQLIQAVPRNVNGRIVLVRAHIRESVTEPYGQWGSTVTEQIRVLYPGYWEVWRSTEKRTWTLYDTGETSLSYIPLFPLYCKKAGFFEGESNLQTLSDLNRALWQSLSDQMNITHVARVPILFGTGFDSEESLVVGTNSAILGPENSTLKYVEHTGSAIKTGRDELNDLRERMMLESLEVINDQNHTAAGKALDVSDSNSSLQDLALRLQDHITSVNNCLCDWSGITREGGAIVDTDFGLHLRDGSTSNILLKMRQNGSLSLQAFQKEMKRYSVLSIDHNIKEDLALLEKEREVKAKADLTNHYTNEDGKQIVGNRMEDNLDTGKPRIV